MAAAIAPVAATPVTAAPAHKSTSPWVPLLSGLSSGLISTALLHPLDVAKTSLINPDKRSSGMLALFREIRSQNGWTGMWRGVVPALARISVGSSIYFTTQTQLLSIIRQRMHEQGSASHAPLSSTSLLVVGFISRASAVSFACPISVVKTRIEGNMVTPYRGLLDGLMTIWRVEGVRGLYTGLLPSVLKDSPYSAVYLLCYSRLKSALVSWDHSLHWSALFNNSGSSPLSDLAVSQLPVVQFCAAFGAGGFATALFQPTEVIKTRLQLVTLAPVSAASSSSSGSGAAAPLSASRHRVLAMTGRIYAEDGLSGFFRGLAPRIIKRSLSNACGWMIFEQIVQFWSGTTGL